MSEQFERFLQAIATLRGPSGCPWDRKQTHDSLKPYFVEETYEALQAIDDRDDEELKGELGDVLLQVGLHAQIASEEGRFSMDDVCRAITEKLIRRHPHVFGDVKVNGVEDVLTNWEAIKSTEKGNHKPASVLDGIPRGMPALMLAMEVSKRAAREGFEWPDMDGVFQKMHEEVGELKEALNSGVREDIDDELGDLLFTVVNIARWAHVDAEESLRQMVRRFRARFSAMEAQARREGKDLKTLTPEQWDDLWNRAKKGVRVDR